MSADLCYEFLSCRKGRHHEKVLSTAETDFKRFVEDSALFHRNVPLLPCVFGVGPRVPVSGRGLRVNQDGEFVE